VEGVSGRVLAARLSGNLRQLGLTVCDTLVY
jgi:hypothetical protein